MQQMTLGKIYPVGVYVLLANIAGNSCLKLHCEMVLKSPIGYNIHLSRDVKNILLTHMIQQLETENI